MIQPGTVTTIVMLPTFDEAGNIEKLLREILSLNDSIGTVVVDDNSPDGTSSIVAKLEKEFPQQITLITRTSERGRATAGIRGHLEAIRLKPAFITEMDADFSHDPRYISTFLKEIQDCDVVLGSRFVPGGKDSDRSPFRTLLSVLSGIVFRTILGLQVRDIGSGFKLYKREVLESLPWNEFFSYGIAISMEECFRIVKKGYRVKEVPIIFVDRRAGYSKLKWKDFFEPVWVSIKLAATFGRA
ncbi:polyprenol monophosphomannose synthase [Candidatus Kaiserbacteria bacterium]|nr:polyprenol monophosphomannose synthase [Candidatus Kaiserbacteria bacterium]